MNLIKNVRKKMIIFASNFVLNADFSTNHKRPFISKRALIGWKFWEINPKQKREKHGDFTRTRVFEKSERMWMMCHLERDQSSIKGKMMQRLRGFRSRFLCNRFQVRTSVSFIKIIYFMFLSTFIWQEICMIQDIFQ